MKLRLSCPDGFSYIGYNRVLCTIQLENVTPAIAALLNAWVKVHLSSDTEWRKNLVEVSSDGRAMYVAGAESFTLAEFGEALSQFLSCEVETLDGPQFFSRDKR